ncbi:MAG: precorrin-3B C(17)-methyltransferase [Desulfobacterales bacterium]|nr:precorrin-3B C(17)-methyltransferase [Desulfobacterales bacterium]
MRSSSDSGRRQRQVDRTQADHPQRDGGGSPPTLFIVGLGPGNADHLSPRAREVLIQAQTIAGYRTYIDLIRPLITDQEIISTGMTREIERAEAVIEAASAGKRCAIVSSGDAGIYAMAGLVLELCRLKGIAIRKPGMPAEAGVGLPVEVVPGIPALAAGAALLGAPLTHDFAAISLSDLLTPWDTIARRLEAAAEADFVIVIYNPRSRRRKDNLDQACNIIRRHRAPQTPVGVVTGAMRANQQVAITTLDNLPQMHVDMQTTLFVGNSETMVYRDFMITPRGYSDKYAVTGERSQPQHDGTG